jgi:hypothetical protein
MSRDACETAGPRANWARILTQRHESVAAHRQKSEERMDPSGNSGQTPRTPPPDEPAWAQPAAPDPAIGTWGTPTAAPAAPAARRGGFNRLAGIIGGIVVLVVLGLGVAFVANLDSGAGKVTFSKTAYHTGDPCKFNSPITEATTADHVYLVALFKDTMEPGDSWTLTVTKDGQPFKSATDSTTTEFGCYVEQDGIPPLAAGVYVVTFTSGGKIEAEGTLTVK